MKRLRRGFPLLFRALFFFFSFCSVCSCAVFRGVTSAEEYYALGMAYFELGKYAEAERWLNRARAVDKTKVASEYNLGRIAFETGRYGDALKLFNRILAKDPQNILALKAAAYTLIKSGELAEAAAYYDRVLALIPESADDGYNYALVLFAMEKYPQAEEVLCSYPYTLDDNADAMLLLARTQNKQDKAEALDNYAKWLQSKKDSAVRYEYAQLLEQHAFYARALEEYRTILGTMTSTPDGTSSGAPSGGTSSSGALSGRQPAAPTGMPERSTLRFAIGRLLLIADPENEEGIRELNQAVADGFRDTAALETLLEREGLSDAQKDAVEKLIAGIQHPPVEGDGASSGAALEADVEGNANEPGK